MQENSVAYELIKELAKVSRNLFYIALLLAIALVVSNMAWLYVFKSYDYTSTTTEVIQETDGGSVSYTEKGDIINGKADGQKDNNGQNKAGN